MSKVAFCPHCHRAVSSVKYGDRIVLYLDRFKPLPEDVRDIKDPRRFTAEGLSDSLGIPIAAVYRAKEQLVAQGILDLTLRWRLNKDGKRVFMFSLTPRGRAYAAALRAFQQSMEEALP
ncbi:MAG: hypothetical protein A4E30_00281 [Methanomassiliicoccales archaeon PtaB.Bin215]|nr:MAG: hypothetical protein A4E30_00281 [Methanomassiliicoccales archaeon PtaB.Bin215]